MTKKVELLAPAGNMEKLEAALLYGADAVYLAGRQYGLRTASDNFTIEEMGEAVSFAHGLNKKVYLTMNILAHNEDLNGAGAFVKEAAATGIDGVIISDPGLFSIVRKKAPELPIHISTQASTVNYSTVGFWRDLGASRVVLAREMSLNEIGEVGRNCPGVELEAFVHGAMCISYSGRCLLSNYLAGRDANKGDCAQSCRWKYHLMEEKRPGEYYPVEETDRGTFIFNSKDLCMINHIPSLIKSGITSFKIEGRVKSAFYVATVVKAYRDAIDAYYANPDAPVNPAWLAEVCKVSNRDFTTGFYFGKPQASDQNYGTGSYLRSYDFIGVVKDYDSAEKLLVIEQRNNFKIGDEIEILPPKGAYSSIAVQEMLDGENKPIEVAPHPQMTVKIRCEASYEPGSILRRGGKD